MKTFQLNIKGLVQGVGFRPFVYKIAFDLHLHGSVENRNDGVVILVNASDSQLQAFINLLSTKKPPASVIENITYVEIADIHFTRFSIIRSSSVSDSITDVSPDIAVCNDCLHDLKTQSNRIDYPFINCTNCGPRFSIIHDLPYDRAKTTMHTFEMCQDCQTEYNDVLDRRFHAQPIACSQCGPHYSLHLHNTIVTNPDEIISQIADLLNKDKIVAIKGIGGYFIACNALSEKAVAQLRQIKQREKKPFAVMFADIASVKEFAHMSDEEATSLQSHKRPIVLLKEKKSLASSVNVGFNTIGSMLPYMPIHHLLFEQLNTQAIVLTSGNISDEPIIIANDQALAILGEKCDAVLTYNRDIHNRIDDSVVTIINQQERVLRRSRGFAPVPVNLGISVDGLLATGAELVNCFCIGKNKQALLSQHIGDLKNMETYEFYMESIRNYKKLFRFNPTHVITDLHPDYYSTRYAEELNLPVIRVQHHHAHIVSCMAEHGLTGKVIGVALDGTGLGDDGHIWGSEFFVCDESSYKRISHFDYMPMPGGDKVTHEPWRMALAYLYKTYGNNNIPYDLPFLKTIDSTKIDMLCNAIEAGINVPLTSGAGRLFDAVAAMINVCTLSHFHAEAPMRLEALIDTTVKERYAFEASHTLSFKETMIDLTNDIRSNIPVSTIAARFHNTVVAAVVDTILSISKNEGIKNVVLSGGVFQNKFLTEQIENNIQTKGLKVFSQKRIPSNDGGLALGQIVIGAHHRRI